MAKGRKGGKGDIPTAIEILEQEDFFELWQGKLFLGQEFLTWLWLRTEGDGRTMRLPNGHEVEVWFENQLQLSLGSGQTKRSVSITTTEEPADGDWMEAYTALAQHKKVSKGTLRVRTGPSEWRFTLSHDTLIPQGIRLSTKSAPEDTEELGKEGRVLERLSSTAELLNILEGLFKVFIRLRVSPEWDKKELPRLQGFLDSQK
ncbi:MAG: hypothetical protein LBF40_10270 [Deltaproteobacteria bacterium]|jgi:hypothetical protein|nr:hypothetical protein [Deltaproteobacteria bacterium]